VTGVQGFQDPHQQQQQQQAAADHHQQQQQPPELAYDQPYDHQYYDYAELPPLPQDDSSTRGAFDQPAHGAVVKDAAEGTVKPFTTTTPINPGPANRRRRRRTVSPPISDIPNSNLGAAVSPQIGLLPREALAAGEQVPAGVGFIEGATANAVPVTAGAMIDQKQQVRGYIPCLYSVWRYPMLV
jgi:hypothetical protein